MKPEPICNWFAMSALTRCTLKDFKDATAHFPIPEEFVFHIYIQLSEAYHFLHIQDPPMVHLDLWEPNVMLNALEQDFAGFPNVVFIDFGLARHAKGETDLVIERECLYNLLYRMATWY